MVFLKFSIILAFISLSAVTSQFIYLNTGVFKFSPNSINTLTAVGSNGPHFQILTPAKFIPLHIPRGIGLPIDVEMSGGSVSWFTNAQVFYKLPDNITYFEPYNVIHKRSVKNTFNRPNLYQAFVKYFSRLGLFGSDCIYRIICEVASGGINHEENGLLGEIIHIIFSPGNDLEEGLEKHKAAQWQGLYNNSDCEVVYKDCHVANNSIFSF